MQTVGSKGWGCWGDCFRGTGFPFGVMEMLWSQVEVVVAQHFEYTERQWTVHFKLANFRSREFYLNLKKQLPSVGQTSWPNRRKAIPRTSSFVRASETARPGGRVRTGARERLPGSVRGAACTYALSLIKILLCVCLPELMPNRPERPNAGA